MKPSANFDIGELVRKGDILGDGRGRPGSCRLGIVVSGPHPARLYNIQFIDERGLRTISTLVHISQLTKVE